MNTGVWISPDDFKYTLSTRAIVIGHAHIYLERINNAKLDTFFMGRAITVWYKGIDPDEAVAKTVDKTVFGVFGPDTEFRFDMCAPGVADTVTIRGFGDDIRYCYCEYLVIPI